MNDMFFAQSYENKVIKKLYKLIKELRMEWMGFGKLRILKFMIRTKTAASVPLRQITTTISVIIKCYDLFMWSLLRYWLNLSIDK